MEAKSSAPHAPASSSAAAMSSVFTQDDRLWRQELLTDLAAALTPQTGNSPSGWFVRPAILRRLAAALSRSVPIETDRIVVTGDFADSLGTALALETGLPFSVVDSEANPRLGVLHSGERVAVASVSSTSVELVDSLSARGVEVLCWRTLVSDPAAALDPRLSFEFSRDELTAAVRAGGQ